MKRCFNLEWTEVSLMISQGCAAEAYNRHNPCGGGAGFCYTFNLFSKGGVTVTPN